MGDLGPSRNLLPILEFKLVTPLGQCHCSGSIQISMTMNGQWNPSTTMRRGWMSTRTAPWPFLLALCTCLSVLGAEEATPFDKGQSAFHRGEFGQAVVHWQKALEQSRKKQDLHGEVSTSISLASAYQSLGQQRNAVRVLEEARLKAERGGNRQDVTWVKAKLGAALSLTQETERAAALLQEAVVSAKTDPDSKMTGDILNDLGNLLTSQAHYQDALKAYEESIEFAARTGNRDLAALARCNAAGAAAHAGDFSKSETLNRQALQQIEALAPSHAQAFLLLTVGQTARLIQAGEPQKAQAQMLLAQQIFDKALKLALELKDSPIQTYALGYLGELYEQDRQLEPAYDYARRAAFVAQQAQMPEALYRWDWLTGRLLKAQGKTDAAIAAYRRSVQTMRPIRNDVSLGYGNSRERIPFRQAQGPLFFELADLLLQKSKSASDRNAEQTLLLEARDTVEQLKVVELESYFCDDCADVQHAKRRAIEAVDEKTAVVYLIPLPTRTELLVGLSTGLTRFTVEVSSDTLTESVRLLRRNLETRTTYEYLSQAQQIYDWIIRPIRSHVAAQQINTLVFVPDGAARTIPFSSLHDGERFLIEDLAVAVTPGLSLVEPKPIAQHKVRLLLNGLSKPVQGFAPLDFVEGELKSIKPAYPSETLLDEGFTASKIQHKLRNEQYSIVHIASHGQFDKDARKTFVLTYDSRLNLNDLEALIRPSQYRGVPVELLVLSACQTAAGDDRAALGLAGVAVKAGARSALATLWFVNDQSTSALITELYSVLSQSPNLTKAQALQAAQIKLLRDRRYSHPCYWSPYLLIGNWL